MQFTALLCIVACVLLIFLNSEASAFRFTVIPGRRKCFTEQFPERGRYEMHYKMVRSLTPFVSVAVTAPGGRVVMEHEVAKPDAKEIISVDAEGIVAICFNVAEKAQHSATSLNVTLEVMDAEDAELTRQKKQSYSTSSQIALGGGKASGAMQQMNYIFQTMMRIRYAYVALALIDEGIRYSVREVNQVAWNYVYIFAVCAFIICGVTHYRLRRYFKLSKCI